MHPAPSVIAFTALSGLGFGYLFFLGLGIPPALGWDAFRAYLVAFCLSVSGLIASTFHLGNPGRAWRAFSQWRSSWLSREAVVSAVALMVMGLYAAGAILQGEIRAGLGIIGATMCLGTVFCTAMIYARLKTVPRWNQMLTPVVFLFFSLTGGAMLAGQVWSAVCLTLMLTATQALHWFVGDRCLADSGSCIGTATGLGPIGTVRLLEPPHTGTNYLLHEMAFKVGRKHSRRLRAITLLTVGLFPCTILIAAPAGYLATGAALALHIVGLFASRWLFFAEAEHVQAFYYDRLRPKRKYPGRV
ncbi:MAG: dimethyl sulfoxide reductase anchor subunit [Rhodobacteraceae bacterium]|nr:dimethyl sulfoxide reductase anchor subunit [Paracoccaceae bacterium]